MPRQEMRASALKIKSVKKSKDNRLQEAKV